MSTDRVLRSQSALDVSLENERMPFVEELFSLSALSAKLTVRKALEGEYSTEWVKAIKKEIDLLIGGGTLVAEDTKRAGGRYDLIHSTMQLKVKMNDDGTINKYKARCCARGDELEGRYLRPILPLSLR